MAILNFNIESTSEMLTPRTGVIIFGEYLKGLNLERLCNTNLPLAKHPNGYTPFEFIYPLILMLNSGGRVLDDIKENKILINTNHKVPFKGTIDILLA